MKQIFTPQVTAAMAGFSAIIIEKPEITATGKTVQEAREKVMKALQKHLKEQDAAEIKEPDKKSEGSKPAAKRKNA